MNRLQLEQHFESYIDVVAPFGQTPEFDSIFAELKKQKSEGGNIIPEAKLIFKAFKEVKLEDLRIIIIGQDPYPAVEYANGLAFSINKEAQVKVPASLEKIIEAVEKDAYGGLNLNKAEFDVSLSHWSKQGIMLLNSALTVGSVEGKITAGSHNLLWRPFIKNFLDCIVQVKKGLIIHAWGSSAHDLVKDLPFYDAFITTAEHPANAAREKREWNNSNCFSFTNAVIRANHKGELITW